MPFFKVIHGIHNSHNMPSGHFTVPEEDGEVSVFSVTFPTYMTNCAVCHDDSTKLGIVNAMAVSTENCFSCHESMESWDFTVGGATFHEGFTAETDCQECHAPGNSLGVPASVAEFHNGLVTERGGVIWDGVDTSVVEGARVKTALTGVAYEGTNMKISWEATFDGAPVDPCNATPAPGAPAFHAIAAGNNMSILRNYAQGDDFILGLSTSAAGQPTSVNLSTTNTACAANVATTTIPVETPPVGATRGIIALQGKPWVPAVDPADADHVMQVRSFTPTREYVVGTGVEPTEQRRPIADSADCDNCHVGSLYQHGGNRVDNVGMCILCHNSASTDQNNRVLMGVDATEAYDGQVGQTFEFKTMIHRIHAAGHEDKFPFVIYRTRGIYAWGPDESAIPNWPGSSDVAIPVFGADPASQYANQTHTFHSPTYPRPLNDCAACHKEDEVQFMPDQAKAMAKTVDAGSTTWTNQVDDVLEGATTAACTACHQDSATKGHANQNGWVPQVFPNGRQTLIDSAQ